MSVLKTYEDGDEMNNLETIALVSDYGNNGTVISEALMNRFIAPTLEKYKDAVKSGRYDAENTSDD